MGSRPRYSMVDIAPQLLQFPFRSPPIMYRLKPSDRFLSLFMAITESYFTPYNPPANHAGPLGVHLRLRVSPSPIVLSAPRGAPGRWQGVDANSSRAAVPFGERRSFRI